jgi:hypothetical protein
MPRARLAGAPHLNTTTRALGRTPGGGVARARAFPYPPPRQTGGFLMRVMVTRPQRMSVGSVRSRHR